MARVLGDLISIVVNAYASEGDIEEEPAEPAAGFFERWAPLVGTSQQARDVAWIYLFANGCEAAAAGIADVRAQYLHALDHEEVARLDRVAAALKRADSQLDVAAAHLDDDRLKGVPAGLRMTPEAVAQEVGEAAKSLVWDFSVAAHLCSSLTGRPLTTEDAWTFWRLIRRAMRLTEHLRSAQGPST